MSNWMAIGAIALIRAYQRLRPFRFPVCRFHPTCSTYAVQAIVVYGFFRGVAKSFRRLIRCHPGCSGGVDPV